MLKIGHQVVRPGKTLKGDPVTIPVAEELETIPGIPLNQREIDWYSREYPLERHYEAERSSYGWFYANRNLNVQMGHIDRGA